jgi:hypothetical protein
VDSRKPRGPRRDQHQIMIQWTWGAEAAMRETLRWDAHAAR